MPTFKKKNLVYETTCSCLPRSSSFRVKVWWRIVLCGIKGSSSSDRRELEIIEPIWWCSSSLPTKKTFTVNCFVIGLFQNSPSTSSLGLCFLRCLSIECFRVNFLWQTSHEKGRSPVCVLMWRRRSSADQNRRMQNAHMTCRTKQKGLQLVWFIFLILIFFSDWI